MGESLRSKAYGLLTSRRGDRLAPVALAKRAVLRVNEAVGRPLACPEELAERRAWEAPAGDGAGPKTEAREAAPVVLFHTDRHVSRLKKLRLVLQAADVPYALRNVEGDLPSIEAVQRESDGRELPVVFIGGECVGGMNELIDLNNSGKLRKLVFG